MRILGIDPGLSVTGYGVIDLRGAKPRLVEGGALRTDAALGLPRRLRVLHDQVAAVIAEFQPDLMGLEDLFSSYRFPQSALKMAHVRGVVCLAAAQAELEVMDLPPATVKNAVAGSGRATKQQVQLAVQHQLELAAPPSPADVADALAVALAAGFRSRQGASPLVGRGGRSR